MLNYSTQWETYVEAIRWNLLLKTFGLVLHRSFGCTVHTHTLTNQYIRMPRVCYPFIWHIGKSFSVATYRCHCVRIVSWLFGSRMVFAWWRPLRVVCEWKEYKSICHAINENSINKFRSTTPYSAVVVNFVPDEKLKASRKQIYSASPSLNYLQRFIWPHIIRIIQFLFHF